MFIIDNLEHETEQSAKNLIAIFQIQTHIEAFDVGQVFQEVKIAFKGCVLGIFQASQLLNKKIENEFDLCWVFVGSFWSEDTQNIRNATCYQKLDISGCVVEKEVIRQVQSQGSKVHVTVGVIGLLQYLKSVC